MTLVLFTVAMKYLNTSNFKGETDYSAYNSRLQHITVGKPKQEFEAGSHIHRQVESYYTERVGVLANSAHCFLPYTIQEPKLGMVCPTIWLGLLPSVHVIKTLSNPREHRPI